MSPQLFATKQEIDMQVSLLLGIEDMEVASVTSTFLYVVLLRLLEEEMVDLHSFGQLWTKGQKLVGVLDKETAEAVRNRLKEAQMEKYAVVENIEQERLEKAASQGCPQCGETKLMRSGNTLRCPHCGTEPFESPK